MPGGEQQLKPADTLDLHAGAELGGRAGAPSWGIVALLLRLGALLLPVPLGGGARPTQLHEQGSVAMRGARLMHLG